MKHTGIFRQRLLLGVAGLLLGCCGIATIPEEVVGQGAPANKKADAWLAKLGALAQQGEVDALIEQVTNNWEPSRRDAAWEQVAQLACNLINWQHQVFQRADMKKLLTNGQNLKGDWCDIGGLKLGNPLEATAKQFVFTNANAVPKSYLVRAENIVIETEIGLNILVASDCIKLAAGSPSPGACILYANDCVFSSASGCVIVCDGEFKGSVHNCLVIARAGVRYWNVTKSVILSGGPVRCYNPNQPAIGNSTILSTGVVEVPNGAKVNNSVIKQIQPDALGPVNFFEPARVGIDVEIANDMVRIKKLDATKMFAKAGLQDGDVLLSLDKKPVASVTAFRKQLRHGLAVQEIFAFEVRRGKKTLNISVTSKI